MMKPKTISIIGGTGQMGTMFAKELQVQGYEVIIAARSTEITVEEAARLGDVVIVTVPINITQKVIEHVGKHVRHDAMITDFTSVKINPVDAMLNHTNADVTGGHPLFGPVKSMKGQNFILCKARGNRYYEWYKSFLESIGLNVIEMSPDEHDKNMGVIQCLNHLSNISLAYTLKNIGFDMKKGEELSSPVYLLRIYTLGRIFAQDPKLYSDIQIHNPYSKLMSEEYLKSVNEINQAIMDSDEAKLEKIFKTSADYFGELSQKSLKITNELIEHLKGIK